MFTLIKNWINAYGSVGDWFGHKIIHIMVGFVLGLTAFFNLYVAVGLVLLAAVGKEVHDHYITRDIPGSSIPLSYHVLDVIITCAGGAAGILLVTL